MSFGPGHYETGIKAPLSYALILLQVFQHFVDYTEKKMKKKPSVNKQKV